MAKDRYSYVAVFDYADDGISIEFPDLFGMEQDGDPIPEPTPITDVHLKKNQVPALIEVFMPPVRDRIKNRFVKKTLSLPAWLASKADESGVNCSKIFQNALIQYLDAEKPAEARG